MPAQKNSRFLEYFRRVAALALISLGIVSAVTARAQAITNLHQLTQTLNSNPEINGDVDLEATVCDASRPKVGVLVVRDETGVELLQVGDFGREIVPGEQIRIRHRSCLLRKREMGIEISARPVVVNDGLHASKAAIGEVKLPAGKIPLRVEWFNYWRYFALEVRWAVPNEPPRLIGSSNLWHAVVTESGATNFLPGLRAECYEGLWETLPDFNLLQPVKTGQATNFDLNFRSRDEGVGIQYSGFLDVPRAGRYQFTVMSDDGAVLYLGDLNVPVVSLGRNNASEPPPGQNLAINLTNLDERCWMVTEGRISFVSKTGEGVRFDLNSAQHVISVRLADATGLDLSNLLNARVRITGMGRGVMTSDQTLQLGKLFAASGRDLVILEHPFGRGEPTLPITSVAQVQSLPIERARQSLPVRIRGVVTGAIKTAQEHWMSFQDDTRGIFVSLSAISNAAPAFGELWEVEGHSAAGDFAPTILSSKATRLGEGLLPPPVSPTWTELLNGSRDVQWAELKGLVTDVHSNTISLYLPDGRLDVELEGSFESDLKPFLRANVRIRGVLYAVWDATTREVRVGQVMMRSSTVSVDVPAPADPFDAMVRTPRELLLFDAQATSFLPVKVRGQIVYADATLIYLQADGAGLRLLPAGKTDLHAGDLVEAVGYPDIGRTALLMREVILRKTGAAALPAPKQLAETELTREDLDSTRLRMQGQLLGWHFEQGAQVLEMQSGTRLYLARLAPGKSNFSSLRADSSLGLTGVYVRRGRDPLLSTAAESFDLLLNSPADIVVLSQPSWWTLQRLLILVGVLLVILASTVIWNRQLRRLVEQRTNQLQHETRERERVQHQHALEAERSRIARDLHDDLGSSLTEISVLASTGQFRQTSADHQPNLFQTIGAKARLLVSALDVIVWAVDPEDNSLQSLADYLSGYAEEFFAHTSIACRFKVPVSFPAVTLEGRVRHEVLMAVKEAFNNIVRHAGATEVEFGMDMADSCLEINIADNGKGLENESPSDGHGLKNLSARLQKLGGHCKLESKADGGTLVKFRLPLGATKEASLDKTDKP
ncbi:MAG: ATP-binding protein [Verrucomicrobiae bacterium]|nr:ATP-binding protein [Verrucomicrobiae bacterium]